MNHRISMLLGLVMMAIAGTSCSSLQEGSGSSQTGRVVSHVIPRYPEGLYVMPNHIDLGEEAIRFALASSATWISTNYCIEIWAFSPGKIKCKFQKQMPKSGIPVERFNLSTNDWTNLKTLIRDTDLLHEAERVRPICVGRPYFLWLELRIGGVYHFIERDCPNQAHEERHMSGLLRFCSALIDCVEIPDEDKQAMKKLIGVTPQELHEVRDATKADR